VLGTTRRRLRLHRGSSQGRKQAIQSLDILKISKEEEGDRESRGSLYATEGNKGAGPAKPESAKGKSLSTTGQQKLLGR
jgi:hypothetical protein